MPNPGLGSVQLGTTWIETGIQPGNPERYKSRNVLRLGNSNVPYEEHNLYVPGKKKESLADKRLHTMLKTQLSNEIDIKKLNVVSFNKGELEKLDANQSGLIEYKRNIKTIVTDLFEERESANSDAVQEVKRIIDEKLLETLKLPLKKKRLNDEDLKQIDEQLAMLWSQAFIHNDPLAKQIIESLPYDIESLKRTYQYGLLHSHPKEVSRDIVTNMLKLEYTEADIEKIAGNPEPKNKIRRTTVDEINKNKMNKEDFEKLKSMKGYREGEINSTLYIKNICKSTTLEELKEIFELFHSKIINKPHEYTYFTKGKLKGQAFIALEDNETAKRALETANRYLLNESPLIISYSKKK